MTNNSSFFWNSVYNIASIANLIKKKREESGQYEMKVLNVQSKEKILDENENFKYNLIALRKNLKSKRLLDFITYCFFDTYRFQFEKQSSVGSSIGKFSATQSDLDKLVSIDLREHTYGVINEMIKLLPVTYNSMYDFFILAALVHDYGKSVEMKKEYGIDA